MNLRLVPLIALIVCLLSGCGTTDRVTHPGVAILGLEQSKGWFGIHLRSQKKRVYLVVKAIDGQPAPDPKLPAGLSLAPGVHSITLSARKDSATLLSQKLGGSIGARLGQHFGNAPSRHDRTLTLRVLPGHDYAAHMRKNGDSYDYWIEDETDDRIVSDTRL
jgi:hypothetical protein